MRCAGTGTGKGRGKGIDLARRPPPQAVGSPGVSVEGKSSQVLALTPLTPRLGVGVGFAAVKTPGGGVGKTIASPSVATVVQ